MEVEATAPGKVILHGEHSVVYGTKAIAISVGLHTKVQVLKAEGNSIRLKFHEVGLDSTFTTAELDTLRNAIKGVGGKFSFDDLNATTPIVLNAEMVKVLEDFVSTSALIHCKEELKVACKAAFEAFLFLYLAMFGDCVPVEIIVTTELPVGAGLGSSASFGVALAGALLISSGRMDKTKVDRDLLNRWAFTSECFVHGTPSGIDNSVATFGGAIMFRKGEPLVHLNCSGIRVLLVDTQVPRSTKALVAKCAAFKEANPSRHAQIMDEINTLVEGAVGELSTSGQTTPAFISQNQNLLQELTVSHPKIDLIVDIAKKHGLAAKLTGAGGGGCVFIFLPPKVDEEAVVAPIKADLVSNGLTKLWDITLGGVGFECKCK